MCGEWVHCLPIYCLFVYSVVYADLRALEFQLMRLENFLRVSLCAEWSVVTTQFTPGGPNTASCPPVSLPASKGNTDTCLLV